MAENVVTETIFRENIGFQVAVVVQPVVGELLGAEDQDSAIAQFITFDDRKRREGLAESDAVCKDAAAVRFELVDNACGGVALKVIELLPDETVLVAKVVGQNVRADVFEEIIEDVVEHQEVNALGGVLLVDGRDVFAEPLCDVFQLGFVVPDLIEEVYPGGSDGGLIHPVHHAGDRIARLITQVNGGKTMNRHINGIGSHRADAGELLHGCRPLVGTEGSFAAYPGGTFAGDGALG